MTSEQKKQLNFEGASWVSPVNVVVAQDGSGDFTSVQAAVDAAPQTGITTAERYVIYIKSGVYDEQVIVPTAATNFMLLGDGAGASVITGNRSVALTPGMTTFMSATLSKKIKSELPTQVPLPVQLQIRCRSISDHVHLSVSEFGSGFNWVHVREQSLAC